MTSNLRVRYPTGRNFIVSEETLKYFPYTFSREGNVWERNSILLFFHILKKLKSGNIVVDVGAQCGSFSLISALLPSLDWIAIEPLVKARKCLEQNLKLNKIANVKVLPLAICEKVGRVTMNVCETNLGLSHTGALNLRFSDNDSHQIEVDSASLDSLIYSHFREAKIGAIKIDIEGGEVKALKGAKKIISRDKPLILIENNEDNLLQSGVNQSSLNELMTELGYKSSVSIDENILFFTKNFIYIYMVWIIIKILQYFSNISRTTQNILKKIVSCIKRENGTATEILG